MTGSTESVSVAPNPQDQESFAKWIGIDPAVLTEDAPAEDATAPDAAPAPPADEPAEAAEDAEKPEADAGSDDPADPEPEPIKLPFEAKANDEAVDPALLAGMEITLKADGKEVTLPLADVVRRAQSEPAAQRQARQATEQLRSVEAAAKEYEDSLTALREYTLRVLSDPQAYEEAQRMVEGYNAPEARAERAERALAERQAREAREQEQRQFQEQVQTFATEFVVPTLSEILESAPLLKQEELLGKFYADTAAITVNGVIPPQYHQELAHYFRTEFSEYAKTRQAEEAAKEARIRAEARKTQVERQKMKNQTAGAAKPPVNGSAPTNGGVANSKPRTAKEAEQSALSALLNGLS